MYEKVNPSHPDKVADRIAGALVDLAYKKEKNPKIAVEVLIGHGMATIMVETSEEITNQEINEIVSRISGITTTKNVIVPQDKYLAENQSNDIRCGDNGIFKGCVVTLEQKTLTSIAHIIYDKYGEDGKYVIDSNSKDIYITVCQSHMAKGDNPILSQMLHTEFGVTNSQINPLGEWTGGPDVDCGATNRKLGSDMGDAVTGGGLMGKDLSKADVSINIVCHLMAQEKGECVFARCAIGDEFVDFTYQSGGTKRMVYHDVVDIARNYIEQIGGFEKFAEWGLIR